MYLSQNSQQVSAVFKALEGEKLTCVTDKLSQM